MQLSASIKLNFGQEGKSSSLVGQIPQDTSGKKANLKDILFSIIWKRASNYE